MAERAAPSLPPGPLRGPALPELPTLWLPASWRNRSGHVDRSACLDLSAKEAIGLLRSKKVPAENGIGRLTTQTGLVSAAQIMQPHNTRRPRTLCGDYRWKCPAMRPVVAAGKLDWSALRLPAPDGPDHRLPFNPNKGAGWSKVAGLPADWRQALRVESWVMNRCPIRGDPAKGRVTTLGHFLVCPRAANLRAGRQRLDQPPALSRRGRGTHAPGWGRHATCGERARKLYLPLCWPEEAADARVAQRWLEELDMLRRLRKIDAAQSPLEALVIERYGQVFAPRALLCGSCLGLAFGRVIQARMRPEKRRWFHPRQAPELPDPFARNRLGRQFQHDQLRHPLPKSALKNKATRAAAMASSRLAPATTRGKPPNDPVGYHDATIHPAWARGLNKDTEINARAAAGLAAMNRLIQTVRRNRAIRKRWEELLRQMELPEILMHPAPPAPKSVRAGVCHSGPAANSGGSGGQRRGRQES